MNEELSSKLHLHSSQTSIISGVQCVGFAVVALEGVNVGSFALGDMEGDENKGEEVG